MLNDVNWIKLRILRQMCGRLQTTEPALSIDILYQLYEQACSVESRRTLDDILEFYLLDNAPPDVTDEHLD